MTQRTYTTDLDLCVAGRQCSMECELTYEYEPAGGDGWNEPRYPAYATLLRVEVAGDNNKTLDLYPLLSAECVQQIEADCAEHERDEHEEARADRVQRMRGEAWL